MVVLGDLGLPLLGFLSLGDDVGGGTRYLALATTRACTQSVDLAGFCELFTERKTKCRHGVLAEVG